MTCYIRSNENPVGENFVDLLSRLDKIPLERIVDYASKYNCLQEFAGIVYILHHDLDIKPELILGDLNKELERQEKMNVLLPKNSKDLYNFAVKESRWITYLRESLLYNLYEEIKNIHNLFSRMEKLTKSDLITLVTQLMMERQFTATNKLMPVINQWVLEHPNSTELDAAVQIYASLNDKIASKEIYEELDNARDELIRQIEDIGDILSNTEESNWILRALIEVEILLEDLLQPLQEVTSKALADIIIWLLSKDYENKVDEFTTKQGLNKLIVKFQLESSLGLSTATPLAKLEYNLLSLSYKEEIAKSTLAEKIIIEAWNEARITRSPLDIGRELLALLMDYCNLPSTSKSKVPTHFEYVTTYYKTDKTRLNRSLKIMKNREKTPSDAEIQEAIILDYLIQFTKNYIVGKMKADPNDLEIPERTSELDISIAEKEVIDMIDAALNRGLRSHNKQTAIQILEQQITSLYPRLLNVVQNEVAVGETILYGIFNNHGKKISREDAREFITGHFKRMQVSLETSSKKRIDSVVKKAISIEIVEKIIYREIR